MLDMQRRRNSGGNSGSPTAAKISGSPTAAKTSGEKSASTLPKLACIIFPVMLVVSLCAFTMVHLHTSTSADTEQMRSQENPTRVLAGIQSSTDKKPLDLVNAGHDVPLEPVQKDSHESTTLHTNPIKIDPSTIELKPTLQRFSQDPVLEALAKQAIPSGREHGAEQVALDSAEENVVEAISSDREHVAAQEALDSAEEIGVEDLGSSQNNDVVSDGHDMAEDVDHSHSGFALIPRPASIESLAGHEVADKPNADDAAIIADLGSANEDNRTKAMFGAYQDLFGLELKRRDLSAESAHVAQLNVAIIIRSSADMACETCTRLTGLDLKPPKLKSTTQLREWHIAVWKSNRLFVCAVDPEGAFRFATTLRQMLHNVPPSARTQSLPSFDSSKLTNDRFLTLLGLQPFLLQDRPRYEWRGLQLDTVRHFMPMEFLKQYLRAMSYYKANTFHWHLSDDQAWRLFIPSRPKLVEASATPGFYSTEDVQEIVEYARRLFITVVPVIETPGHSLAALAAYPELACEGKNFKAPLSRVGTYDDILCVGKPEVEDFAKDVFAEVARLFPGKFVHIGGDEIPTVKWERSHDVKAYSKREGLKNYHADVLESWYCFLTKLLKTHNRTILMWDDHFADRIYGVTKRCPGAEQDWIVQAWKLVPPVGDSDKQERVVSTFPFRTVASSMKSAYLDYPVASIDFNKTLKWHLGDGHVLGGCANMWTEDSEPEQVGEKVYPRYLGLAERMWDSEKPAAQKRRLDLHPYVAAQRHCDKKGPLLKEFNFKCGRFEIRSGGRQQLWKNTAISSMVDAFGREYMFDRALDGDPDTYFWGISPKRHDTMDVYWTRSDITPSKSGGPVLGKCLARIAIATGSKDRPGDFLEKGHLIAAQWVSSGGNWSLKWTQLGHFVDGKTEANPELLSRGPVVGLRIKVTVEQTKWVTIPEIEVEECEPHSDWPQQENLPNTSPAHFFGSLGSSGERLAFGSRQ